jgi:hypothetical protein
VPLRAPLMAPKHHPTPLSGGDRKALARELTRARAMTRILTGRAAEKRAAGEALIREADDLPKRSVLPLGRAAGCRNTGHHVPN